MSTSIEFRSIDRHAARSETEWRKEHEAEASRLDFLLSRLPGSAIRAVVGVMSDTNDPVEWRARLDEAMDRAGVPHQRACMHVGLPKGVEAIHRPTGAMVVCTHERSQHANRDAALRGLQAILGTNAEDAEKQ